jgi:hypothetical protein
MNPLTTASMATAVDVAREAAAEAPMILWPADWPAPELVAWTLAQMLAETLPAPAGDAAHLAGGSAAPVLAPS